MKTILKATITILIVALGANVAAAQEDGTYIYILGNYLIPERALDLDEGEGVQAGVGVALGEHWNLEGLLQYTRTGGSSDVTHSTVGADLQFVFNRDAAFQPYLFVGAGYQEVDAPGNLSDDGAVYAGGAGFRAKVFGSSRVSLRGEYRYRDNDVFGLSLNDNIYSLGLQIPFGDRGRRVVDSDGDGVADELDRCPNTPVGTEVDGFGCERDDDNDGVVNRLDRCPDTPVGTAVDGNGCARDSDGDGIADNADRCPNTIRGATVDARGCELDGDNDGVVDRLDRCPNSEAGVQVDISGCEIKEVIRLPGVNFESNSDRLIAGADSVLNAAVATLKKNPEIKVEVAGHTDSDGAAQYNDSLSARRAATVRDYLINNGIAAERLTMRGYGESRPIADNGSAQGKATNRRVVLRLTDR